MSVDGSVPTIFAFMLSSFEKLTSTERAPSTTWKFVTMWPALSITKPEPSDSACCWVGKAKPKNGSALALETTVVAVTCTTPGAARR